MTNWNDPPSLAAITIPLEMHGIKTGRQGDRKEKKTKKKLPETSIKLHSTLQIMKINRLY